MADFVVDSSATLAWCFRDESIGWVEALFQQLTPHSEILVPRHWAFEVANAFVIAMRRGRLTIQGLEQNFEVLRALPIYTEMTSDSSVFTTMVRLAEKHGLSVYDAAYLELAKRANLPLATLDDDLRRAAVSAGVAVLR
jgi:predicted nucleic acid-binding protein